MIGKGSLFVIPWQFVTILPINSLNKCYPHRMLSTFFISLCFLALYGNALNNSFARVPQREVVCLCSMTLCENVLYQTGNNTHHSSARCSLRHLGAGLCGESFCWKPMEHIASFLISFGLMITLTSYLVLLLFREIRGHNRTSVNHRRRLGSGYWTRRRSYWRRRQLSRSRYIREAIWSSMKQRKITQSERSSPRHDALMKTKYITPIRLGTSNANPAVTLKRTRDGHVEGDAKINSYLEGKKSLGRRKRDKSSTNGCRRMKSHSPRKIGISSSNGFRESPSKHFRFFATPKRTKKRMGFRRRCGNALNLPIASVSD